MGATVRTECHVLQHRCCRAYFGGTITLLTPRVRMCARLSVHNVLHVYSFKLEMSCEESDSALHLLRGWTSSRDAAVVL